MGLKNFVSVVSGRAKGLLGGSSTPASEKSLEDFVWKSWRAGVGRIVPNGSRSIFLTPESRQYVVNVTGFEYETGQRCANEAMKGIASLVKPGVDKTGSGRLIWLAFMGNILNLEGALRESPFGYSASAEILGEHPVRVGLGKLLGTLAARCYYIGMASAFEGNQRPDLAERANEAAAEVMKRYGRGAFGIAPLAWAHSAAKQ